MTEPLLSVRNLKKHYPLKRGFFNRQVGAVKAVDGISFDIQPGETVGLVGESGCGKSTAATSILRLEEPTDGEVIFNGGDRVSQSHTGEGPHPNDVTEFNKVELKRFRRDAQMIFQDPASSFNPRIKVGSSVAELLLVHGMKDRSQRRAIVEDLLTRVGLSESDYDRYPHEFSGGQKQRIALARALVLNPDLIVADEPVSALDVSVQAEVLSLIHDLQEEFDLSILFISHNMSVIQSICDRVAVMYLGEIVEIGTTEQLFSDPQHPYTEALLSSIPTPNPRQRRKRIELTGTVPSPSDPPSGCRFHTRCHRVVQPDELNLDQTEWRRLLNLRESVESRLLDIESVRDSIPTDGEPSETAVRVQIRDEFDLPDQLSDRGAEQTLESALDAVIAEEMETATELFRDSFTTPCEMEKPEFTEHGGNHRSSCIRHEMDVPSAELVSSDD